MITLARPIRSGDTLRDTLTVHLPESSVVAHREDGRWVVQATAIQSHRLQSRSKHWVVIPTPVPEPVPEPVPDPVGFPILDDTVSALEDELDAGVHDEHLSLLLAAEVDGKDRSTAIRAIQDRAELVSG